MLLTTTSTIAIRASATTGWSDCERRGAANSFAWLIEQAGFELRKIATGIAAPIGIGTHGGWAHEMGIKAKEGFLPSLIESREVAMAALDQAIQESAEESGRNVEFDQKTAPTLNAAQKQTARLLEVVHRQLSPQVSPIAVEDELKADLGDGVELVGHRDNYATVIVFDKAGSGTLDLKTSAHKGLHMPQIGSYSLLGATKGQSSDWLGIFNVPRVPLRQDQPDGDLIRVDPFEAESAATAVHDRMKSTLLEFMEKQNPHVFLANSSSRMCSERWCRAWGTEFCKEHLF